jgi:hypothetical protein
MVERLDSALRRSAGREMRCWYAANANPNRRACGGGEAWARAVRGGGGARWQSGGAAAGRTVTAARRRGGGRPGRRGRHPGTHQESGITSGYSSRAAARLQINGTGGRNLFHFGVPTLCGSFHDWSTLLRDLALLVSEIPTSCIT